MRRLLTFAIVGLLGCGPDHGSGAVAGAEAGDAQTPPTARAALESWLQAGDYKAWHCEPAPHDARRPSAHGQNRICSNDRLASHGDGPFPVGAAAVKEIHDGGAVVGYAVYRKVQEGGGDGFYWYESIRGELAADGIGSSGRPKDSCVSCHEGAGRDGRSGHDLVFTQVK